MGGSHRVNDLIELVLLLLLMVTGYSATRPHRRIERDALAGFAGWLVVFGILIALVSVPAAMAWAVRLAITLGAAYVLWWIGAWIFYEFSGMPEIPPITRRQVFKAIRFLSERDRRGARDAVRQALRTYGKEVVLSALVSVCADGRSGRELREGLFAECAAIAERHSELVERLRIACRSERGLDFSFIGRLAARYGEGTVGQGLERLLDASHPTRAHLPGLVYDGFDDVTRAERLSSIHIEIHPPRADREMPRVVPGGRLLTGAANLVLAGIVAAVVYRVRAVNHANAREVALCAYLVIGVFTPMYIYLSLNLIRRTLLFGLPYALLLGYAVLRFRAQDPAAWVFLSAVALMHISALLNLQAVCWMHQRGEREA